MDLRRLLCSVAIAGSAALLFVIQPIIAKTLLPRFGGTAGVWVVCMMFFQLVLLLGYLYSFCITRYPNPTLRTAIHLSVLALSLGVLPLRPAERWSAGNPTLSILLTLALSVGLPFFLLSTTSTLLQSWYTGAGRARLPYGFFALSNIASLVALLSYPVAIEPALPIAAQLRWWSGAYAGVVLLIAIVTIDNRTRALKPDPGPPIRSEADMPGTYTRPLLWIALAACPSILWLAVANYLSQEVAPIPYLWVLPLALYLLSFVVCFAFEDWYRPVVFRWLLPIGWLGIALRIGMAGAGGNLSIDLPALLAALFLVCMFCHGELVRSRPVVRRDVAFFYLMVAAGGALGGVFVGLAAPAVFSSYLELPIGVVGSVFLGLVLLYRITSPGRLIRLGAFAIATFVVVSQFSGSGAKVEASRNFYGTLQVRDSGTGDLAVRSLYNGRTVHGIEFLSPARSHLPTAYYGPQSGVGLLLDSLSAQNRRVAVVGLGAGTLAAYGRKSDFFRFYEINPAVIHAASAYFRFLADSGAATDVIAGDGRLRLEHEPAQSFDVIVLDAFSDDAIPVHLLTREAFQIYFARLRPGGSLAIHVTSRYLDLNPVVAAAARALNKDFVRIHSPAEPDRQVLAADWAVVSDWNQAAARLSPQADRGVDQHGPLWTDEQSNLFQVWR